MDTTGLTVPFRDMAALPSSGRPPVARRTRALAVALAVAATTLLAVAAPGGLPPAGAAAAQTGGPTTSPVAQASTAPASTVPASTVPASTAPGPNTPTEDDGGEGTSASDGSGNPLVASVSPVLASRGWFTEAGGGAESRTLERLSRRLRADGSAWGLVALSEKPDGGTRFFAKDVLDELRSTQSDISTVVVLTPSEIAADSRTYAGADLDQALTQAIPDFQRDVTAGYERLFQLLAGAPLTDDLAPVAPSSGAAPQRSTVPLFVAGGVLLVVAAVVVAMIGSRRAART